MIHFIKLNRIPLLLTLISMLFYVSFAYDLVRSDFVKLITLYAGLFFLSYKIIQISKGSFWLLAGIGILFRFVFIGVFPNLSQDFYRFLWDGRLLVQGINPYLFTPENIIDNLSTALEETNKITVYQAQKLYDGMGSLNASHFSNYPPVNQLCFAIASLFTSKSIIGSVIVLRLLIILADIGILYFGRKLLIRLGIEPHKLFWYFLNPFIIIELTGNLHFESVMLFFLIWSLYLLHKRKWIWAAVLFGLSVSVKLIPLLFLPLFFQWFTKQNFRKGFFKLIGFYLVVLLAIVATFLPFLSKQFASNFLATISLWFQNFEFNASVYYVIRWIGFQTIGWNIIESVGKILPLVVVLYLLISTFFRKNKSYPQLLTGLLLGISCYFLLSTTVHPWYVATPLLLSLFTRYKFPIVWSFVIMFSYSAYAVNGFSENLWFVAIEYIVVIGYFLWEVFSFRRNETVVL